MFLSGTRSRQCLVLPLVLFSLMVAKDVSGQAKKPPMPALNVVAVDPLIKVFRDDAVDGGGKAHTDVARGEHLTFQLVVTGGPVDIYDLVCSSTEFVRTDRDESGATIPAPAARFVSYVGSSISMDTTASDQLRAAPAMYPDPLLPKLDGPVRARENQALWLTRQVPLSVEAGDYVATATLTAKVFGVETSATVPLSVKVWPVTVADTRLDVTHWYQMWYHKGQQMPERYSDEWFEVLRGYVRNMRVHRQNWGWIESMAAMGFSRGNDGRLQVDFSNFDQWVEVLFEEGMEKLEGQHYAFRTSGWRGPFGVQIMAEGDDGKWGPKRVEADSSEAREFYREFFPVFQTHLEERGWLDKYWQHVADEPLDSNADSFTTAAMLLKEFAPRIRTMDACQSQKVAGLVDIWVPQLDHYHKGYEFFKERQKDEGETVWFYTCMYPTGEYANRFLELPLIKTRLLHWINFKYGATGYLHWGYNFWPPHVWQDTADYRQSRLPGGDACIVYPDPDSFGVFDSIRYEAMRDGIEDHELLSQVAERDEALAQRLAERMVQGFTEYDTDVERFRETRRELLEAASQGR